MKRFRQCVWIYLVITFCVSHLVDTVTAFQHHRNTAKKSTEATVSDGSGAEAVVRQADDPSDFAVPPMFNLASTKLHWGVENNVDKVADRGIGYTVDGNLQSSWSKANEARKLRRNNYKKKKLARIQRQQKRHIAKARMVPTTDINSDRSKSSSSITNTTIQNPNHRLLRASTFTQHPEMSIKIASETMANGIGQAAALRIANTTETVIDYLHSVVEDPSPIIVGDMSCLKDKFRPAPMVANADIKYLRNELLNQTNAYLEAEYICLPGFRLARTNHSTTVFCRRRRWIGHAPRCERKTPTYNGDAATAAIPSKSTSSSLPSYPNTCPPTNDVEKRRRCHRPLCPSAVGSSSILTAASRHSCRLCRKGFQLNESDNLCWDSRLDNISTKTTFNKLRVVSDEVDSLSSVYALDDSEINMGDTDPDRIVCPPLIPPKHGYLECSRWLHKPHSDSGGARAFGYAASGRQSNRPGSQCVLRCPTGYWEAGRIEKICDFNGRWVGVDGGSCIEYQSPVKSTWNRNKGAV